MNRKTFLLSLLAPMIAPFTQKPFKRIPAGRVVRLVMRSNGEERIVEIPKCVESYNPFAWGKC